jgi:hypothetical protein
VIEPTLQHLTAMLQREGGRGTVAHEPSGGSSRD